MPRARSCPLNLPRSIALPATNTNPTKPSPMDTDEPDDAKTTAAARHPTTSPSALGAHRPSGQDHPEDDAWLLPALHKHKGEDPRGHRF